MKIIIVFIIMLIFILIKLILNVIVFKGEIKKYNNNLEREYDKYLHKKIMNLNNKSEIEDFIDYLKNKKNK